MNQPSLVVASIIIPTWNGKIYIEDCLNSLLAQDYQNFEIILVDNASSDGTGDWVTKLFPTVTLIRNQQNLGFAGAVNIGLRAAKGQVLILFNQDAVARQGWLSTLVTGLLAAPDIGVVGCKILGISSDKLQHAGGHLTRPQAQPSHIGLDEIDTGQYEQPAEVDYVTGAALAFRREVLEAAGYFDETFFFYYEDVDYCYRARTAGFRVMYIPQAVVDHYGNSSLGIGTVAHYAKFHASRLQFVIKHWGITYFVSEFQPVECDWFKNITTSAERVGLRQAYQTIILKIGQYSPALAEGSQAELLMVLYNLRQQIFAAYLDEIWHSLEQPPGVPNQAADRWWKVKERPFISNVPGVGPLIARLRTIWNDVSTRWFVRLILQQQNEVNRILAQRQAIQEQVLYNQGQFLQDLERDQTYMTTRWLETIHQLERIEARLADLEQKDISDESNT